MTGAVLEYGGGSGKEWFGGEMSVVWRAAGLEPATPSGEKGVQAARSGSGGPGGIGSDAFRTRRRRLNAEGYSVPSCQTTRVIRCLLLRDAHREGAFRTYFLADLASGTQAQVERRYGPVLSGFARLSSIPGIDMKYPLRAFIKALAALLRGGAFLLIPCYLYHGITTRLLGRELRSCPTG